MKVISLNVGLPRSVPYLAGEVRTGIFKEPVAGPVLLRRLNLDGDHQADLEVHGGRNKAVYAYASEHYDFWREQLPEMELPWGMFGENLTTEGLLEEHAHIGDQFRIGAAIVKVTQPRLPCYKLGLRFGRGDIIKRFVASRRSGIYFSVVEEGLIKTGDVIEPLQGDDRRISVADVNRAYVDTGENIELARRIVSLEILPRGLHDEFVEALAALQS